MDHKLNPEANAVLERVASVSNRTASKYPASAV